VAGSIVVQYAAHVANLENKVEATLYPNPVAGNELTLQLANGDVKDLTIVVIDKMGRKVYEQAHKLGSVNSTLIPVEKLAAGIYTLQLFDQDKNLLNTQKFTKQ